MPGRLNVTVIDAGRPHMSVQGLARGYAVNAVPLNGGRRVITGTHSGCLRAKPLIQTAGVCAQADCWRSLGHGLAATRWTARVATDQSVRSALRRAAGLSVYPASMKMGH